MLIFFRNTNTYMYFTAFYEYVNELYNYYVMTLYAHKNQLVIPKG